VVAPSHSERAGWKLHAASPWASSIVPEESRCFGHGRKRTRTRAHTVTIAARAPLPMCAAIIALGRSRGGAPPLLALGRWHWGDAHAAAPPRGRGTALLAQECTQKETRREGGGGGTWEGTEGRRCGGTEGRREEREIILLTEGGCCADMHVRNVIAHATTCTCAPCTAVDEKLPSFQDALERFAVLLVSLTNEVCAHALWQPNQETLNCLHRKRIKQDKKGK
jgi:hypothetical protein